MRVNANKTTFYFSAFPVAGDLSFPRTENSVLIGSSAGIAETLKKVEAAGFSEVILYFNVGLKPHTQVKEEMNRFMQEVAPAFG
jgi:hypothetical protein